MDWRVAPLAVVAFTLLSCGSGSTDALPFSCCSTTMFAIRRMGGPPVDYGSWDLEIRQGGENIMCAHMRGVWLCENGSYVGIDTGNKQGMPLESRIAFVSGDGSQIGASAVLRRSGEVLFDGPMIQTSLTLVSPSCDQT